jgi:hypothetical protein
MLEIFYIQSVQEKLLISHGNKPALQIINHGINFLKYLYIVSVCLYNNFYF